MKNIHVIPTDKPSRLFKDDNQVLNLHTHSVLKGIFTNGIGFNQHIYITSDEEIKEGDWCIDDIADVFKIEGLEYFRKFCKKIILTTDQDLINDGVQAIPDDFLEWFVKNPSCEEVDVVKDYNYGNLEHFDYKIIIPKEESKQTVQEYEQQGLEKYSYESEPKQETIYEYTENYKPSFVDLTDILPKQETLEEVADRLYPYEVGYGVFDRNCEIDIERQRFVEGAKWQQEQDKNKYSEEELRDMLQSYVEWAINGYGTYYDWFEQFKKVKQTSS